MSKLNSNRPWFEATLWLLLIGPFFFLTYNFANEVSANRDDVGSIVFEWERLIPFLSWTIFPYWSIDLLYGLSLFVCATRAELRTHVGRMLTAQIVAVTCFLLFPLQLIAQKPEVDGLAGALFDLLGHFDQPYNQAPSLHIALLVVLWDVFRRNTPRWAYLAVDLWTLLIAASVLTTYQHHFIDIPTGFLLGLVCLWLWPFEGPSPVRALAFARDKRRLTIGFIYLAGGGLAAALASYLQGWFLWLFWPAVSLAMVAGFYLALGARGFQKRADGSHSLAAKCLLLPYLIGARINARLWTWRDRDSRLVRENVWIGCLPGRNDKLDRFATVIDLSAEISAPRSVGKARYLAEPLLDLVDPDEQTLRDVANAIEEARKDGPVLVCCALGYSRSAATVAAWLCLTERASSLEEAASIVREARPRIALKTKGLSLARM